MIVRQGWGRIHGVFYEDGSVRDPSIPAAIMGFFRKRTPDILPCVPDSEGWVSRIIDRSNKWLNDSGRTWKDGLAGIHPFCSQSGDVERCSRTTIAELFVTGRVRS